jgi:AhpD family alkylhydroperoxidase
LIAIKDRALAFESGPATFQRAPGLTFIKRIILAPCFSVLGAPRAEWPAARAVEARNARSGTPLRVTTERLAFWLDEARQMTTDYSARIAEIDEYAVELRKLIPEAVGAFGALSKAAQTPGSLDKKTKELLALAISVAIRCEGCVAYHARGAHRAGAARQEVAETLGVAIQMGGGPSMNYAADALRAFDQFQAPA